MVNVTIHSMQYTTDDDDLEGPDSGLGDDSGWKQVCQAQLCNCSESALFIPIIVFQHYCGYISFIFYFNCLRRDS